MVQTVIYTKSSLEKLTVLFIGWTLPEKEGGGGFDQIDTVTGFSETQGWHVKIVFKCRW